MHTCHAPQGLKGTVIRAHAANQHDWCRGAPPAHLAHMEELLEQYTERVLGLAGDALQRGVLSDAQRDQLLALLEELRGMAGEREAADGLWAVVAAAAALAAAVAVSCSRQLSTSCC